jgi:hypothetical protein
MTKCYIQKQHCASVFFFFFFARHKLKLVPLRWSRRPPLLMFQSDQLLSTNITGPVVCSLRAAQSIP